ncbi:hypothetical protein, partial [Oenococcus oeni]|uniref:hypothetical protein n=1 Tax=Oenococcus oeni TaxID=1247 RepID=UPI001C5A9523
IILNTLTDGKEYLAVWIRAPKGCGLLTSSLSKKQAAFPVIISITAQIDSVYFCLFHRKNIIISTQKNNEIIGLLKLLITLNFLIKLEVSEDPEKNGNELSK